MLQILEQFLIGQIFEFLNETELCITRRVCHHLQYIKAFISPFTFRKIEHIRFFSTLRVNTIKKLHFHNCGNNYNIIFKTYKLSDLVTLHFNNCVVEKYIFRCISDHSFSSRITYYSAPSMLHFP